MKFDKGKLATLAPQPAPAPAPAAPKATITLELRCVYCKGSASILHKGTSYCPRCYDERNYTGQLVN